MKIKTITPEEFQNEVIEKKGDGVFLISKEGCAPCEPFKAQLERNHINVTEVKTTEHGNLPLECVGKVTSFPALIRVCGGVIEEAINRPTVDIAYDLLKRL